MWWYRVNTGQYGPQISPFFSSDLGRSCLGSCCHLSVNTSLFLLAAGLWCTCLLTARREENGVVL